MSSLNDETAQIGKNVSSQSLVEKNLVGFSVPSVVSVSVPPLIPNNSTGIVDSAFGSLGLSQNVTSSAAGGLGLNYVLQSSCPTSLPSNNDEGLRNTYVLPSSIPNIPSSTVVTESKTSFPVCVALLVSVVS